MLQAPSKCWQLFANWQGVITNKTWILTTTTGRISNSANLTSLSCIIRHTIQGTNITTSCHEQPSTAVPYHECPNIALSSHPNFLPVASWIMNRFFQGSSILLSSSGKSCGLIINTNIRNTNWFILFKQTSTDYKSEIIPCWHHQQLSRTASDVHF